MRIRPRNDLEGNILAYYSKEDPLRKVLERSQNRLAKGMLSKVSNILTAAGYDGSDPSVLLRQADPSTIREIERIAQGLPDAQRRRVLGKLYGQVGTGSLTVRKAIRDVIEFDQYHASLDLYDKGKRALRPVAEEGMLRGEFMIQKSAGIGWEVESPGIKRVERFLDRQWTQSDATKFLRPMGQVVSDQVAQGLLLGEHPEEISRRVRNVEDISTVRANRMARTTVTAVSNEAHADSFKRHGVKRYEFRAMFNERTCDVCGGLDGKIFNLEDKRPGSNFPPIHPNCRCTTTAALSKEVKERMRQNAIANGHASPIRERETFEEWKAKNVDPVKVAKTPAKPKKIEDPRLYPETVSGVSRGKPMSFKDADGGRSNPMYYSKYDHPYEVNCQTCVVANEMRRRGYDVQATGRKRGSVNDSLAINTTIAWIDPKTGQRPAHIAKTGEDALKSDRQWMTEKMVDRGRYTLEFNWKGRSSGHIINAEKTSDGIRLFDPQSGEVVASTPEEVDAYMKRVSSPMLVRVDNAIPNMEIVDEVLTKGMTDEELQKAKDKRAKSKAFQSKLDKDRELYRQWDDVLKQEKPPDWLTDKNREDAIKWMEYAKRWLF